jgi:hypothetical protein
LHGKNEVEDLLLRPTLKIVEEVAHSVPKMKLSNILQEVHPTIYQNEVTILNSIEFLQYSK